MGGSRGIFSPGGTATRVAGRGGGGEGGPCGKLDRRNRFHRPAPQAEELRGHFIAEPENRLKQNSLQNWTSRSTGSHVIAWLKYLIVKNCINISQRLPPSSRQICYGHNFRLKTPKARTFIHFNAMFFFWKIFSPKVVKLMHVGSLCLEMCAAENWNDLNMLNLNSARDVRPSLSLGGQSPDWGEKGGKHMHALMLAR